MRFRKIAAACMAAVLSMTYAFASGEQPTAVRYAGYTVSAQAAIVMEASSGRVLFEQNSQKKLPMASTTKIMTALLTLEQPDRDSYFVVDTEAIHVEGTTMGLVDGDSVTLNQLAAGMLLPSGNDAAGAAAVRISGSQEEFVKLMNERAQELGMKNTSYITVSGLDTTGHYSTAYDMAVLTRKALENEDFREICSQKEMRLNFGNPPYSRSLYNTNKLLEKYPYAIGVKTGFTDEAGMCLVSAAERDGVTLIAVTLNGHDDVNTHRNMLEEYFTAVEHVELEEFSQPVEFDVAGGFESKVTGVLPEVASATIKAGERSKLKYELDAPKFVYAPVKKGDILGTVRVYGGNDVLYEGNLIADRDIAWLFPPKKEWSFLSKLFK